MNDELLQEVSAFKANKERLLGRLLNRTYRYMSDLAGDYLKGVGYENFRVGHIVALVHIGSEGTNINKLAAGAGMTKQGMSKLIKELQIEGFVDVVKDQTDARALIVKLTEKGFQAMIDWKKCTQHINQKFAEILGEDKLDLFKDIMVELVNDYENKYLTSSRNYLNHPMMQANWMAVK
ncbi:MarR family winged helix-turn-helix transcriptional regulator [Emticicia sp. SJ17W-69]|uniref:MarR family winged helix-turn-helix transcriptional regulator n=1 Tax=Emticicia sp. SJ17W-69 TaxID=3421657 RepID=UPI003EB6E3DF